MMSAWGKRKILAERRPADFIARRGCRKGEADRYTISIANAKFLISRPPSEPLVDRLAKYFGRA
jgi:hypothetical protein